MNKVTEVLLKPLQKSIYLKPFTMYYTQNGKEKTWDLLTVHDSVAIILYNVTRNVLIFVKQFRPAVYLGGIPEKERTNTIDTTKYPPETGITLELCAGIVDKNMTLEEIAAEEVLEECGYKVEANSMKKVASYRSGVGTSGSIQTSYYCEVTDDMKVTQGGGVEDEIIEVVEMTVQEVEKYMNQDHVLSPPSFLFNISWFLQNKVYKYKL
ncbi:uridine diphosphate glucose pyrophosphatase NUDT14-like [Onthophagus taurus]|uniref:uridine diphosphate glucose pyrophosphatase NUDT14-like n=1 Tax=Onthophagus taurus TaxID=166361 RepID=UPI000C209776|nr:uridine diphosphate glucose pyrophosphatase-like [Onthophagus taurus]